MEVTAAGFRWEVALVPAIEVAGGVVVSLAGRSARDELVGERPAWPVDWNEEFARTVLTREPAVGGELVTFADAHRMFSARFAWPVLIWRLKG